MKEKDKRISVAFLFTGLILITFFSNGQDMKLTKEQKKEIRKKELEGRYATLDSLLASRRFVLAADFLQGRSGERVMVTPTLNFVKVNGETGTLQVGANSGIGYNGLGGATAEGSIAGWVLEKNSRNHTISVRFNITSAIGHYDVLIIVSASNNTSATITGLSSGSLAWTGHLESLDKSRVFQGQTNY